MSLFVEPEGATELNADDVAGLKFDHITTREELNVLENANILQGLNWLATPKTLLDVNTTTSKGRILRTTICHRLTMKSL